ncbi:DUF6894 family protein [Methylobacterium oxalidis]|uniref:DUF6894 domain-containing protein n=1 Tax=Methylobacterium oxalidis TaxID=944322 RepID=A0A512J724_9HYPH|nr:hypothetical protein [Methylobacterium oxalidis]GEP05692.1 hypothetical protein MOX02_37300 [Methylobacterium oxalidis]GJE32429.1 hypothetical protein LDDCCGHA_2615 [Methylobacterium oxalidis]GLS63171.1 hypothetical protein GCM10007888_15520 [Methylobacterium oxalidis]
MPHFYLHFRTPLGIHRDDEGSTFADLDAAYLSVCETIPDIAADLWRSSLRKPGADPFACAFEITDAAGRILMDVPFLEILDPARTRFRAKLRPDLC